MKALVNEGHIVASISANMQNNKVRAQRMLAAIDYAKNVWIHKNRVNEKIAFIGHSRGGEAVTTAAREHFIHSGQTAGAVISLMGTDNQEGGGDPEFLLSPISTSYLALVAGRDEDVVGTCIPIINGCGNMGRNAASLYDRVGREWGFWDVGDYMIDKSIKLLPKFSHASWFNDLNGVWGINSPNYFALTQRKVVHEYVIRFLDWQLNGNTSQRQYFDGTRETNLIPGVINQYVQHSTPNLVIDTFENFVIQNNDWGKNLVFVSGPASFSEGAISLFDRTIPNDSHGLAIRWKQHEPSIIKWTFPKNGDIYHIPTADVSNYPFLSFRATQIYGSRLNKDTDPKARIRLTDIRNRSAEVLIGANTAFTLPNVELQGPLSAQFGLVNTVTNMMRTLRIPISAFANIDLSAIRSVSIIVGQDSPQGAIVIDSIEFSH